MEVSRGRQLGGPGPGGADGVEGAFGLARVALQVTVSCHLEDWPVPGLALPTWDSLSLRTLVSMHSRAGSDTHLCVAGAIELRPGPLIALHVPPGS